MGAPVANLNPKVLKWARQATGLSKNEVAERFKKDESVVQLWETGKESPTYPQLERLAYQIYKRPLAIFFFPEPPDEETPEHSFRTLPGFKIEDLSPRVRYLRREALAMKEFLSRLHGGANEKWSAFISKCDFTGGESAIKLASTVREQLGVSFEEQLSWKSTNEAFEKWRTVLASTGVFVYKEAFDQESLSGFCLYDDTFPVIYINNSNARSRQIFSLFHELAHLIARTGGVTTSDESFIDSLPPKHKEIERFCNEFASEVLIPNERFKPYLSNSAFSDLKLSQIAKAFSVSKEAILRKYLDAGNLSPTFYETKVAEWNKAYKESKKVKKSGGDYYATHTTYLGVEYLKLAFSSLYRGQISHDDAARYLKVKPGNLEKLEDFYYTKVGK